MGGTATLGVLALILSQSGLVLFGSLAGVMIGPMVTGLEGGLLEELSDRLVVLVMVSPLMTSEYVTDCLTNSSVTSPPTKGGLGLDAAISPKLYKCEGAFSKT